MSRSQAADELIAMHGPQLVLFARRWTADHSAAEDIVQEGFIRFWQNRQQVHDPLAYLYQCVRTAAVDHVRKQQSRHRQERTAARRDHATPLFAAPLEQQERTRQIETALAQLPDEQAEVLTLKIWSALTFAQIAEVTSTPPGTVASRYRYAIEHLRRLLDDI